VQEVPSSATNSSTALMFVFVYPSLEYAVGVSIVEPSMTRILPVLPTLVRTRSATALTTRQSVAIPLTVRSAAAIR